MMGILGRKVGMTTVFDDKGATVPVTVIDATDCLIAQVKTQANDGYSAVQLAFGDRKPQNFSKPKAGTFKKAGTPAKIHLKEVRSTDEAKIAHLKAGQKISVSMFKKGDRIDVIATTRGKGFQGVVKRHGFHGADATHGVHEYFRHGGSVGTNTFPGRIMKNKGMPGQTGNVPRTVHNLVVAEVDETTNQIWLRGAVPGSKGGIVFLRSGKKAKKASEMTWVAKE